MKTTIQIPDSLIEEARRVSHRERITLRALVEEGLRRVLADRARGGGFRLRRVTFKGKGLQPGLEGASRERIREKVRRLGAKEEDVAKAVRWAQRRG